MTGQGYYFIGTSRHTFFNLGVKEARVHTYHRMVLVVLRGGKSHRNGAYQRQSRCWMIKPQTVRPLMEGEVAFATLKWEVERMQWPTKE